MKMIYLVWHYTGNLVYQLLCLPRWLVQARASILVLSLRLDFVVGNIKETSSVVNKQGSHPHWINPWLIRPFMIKIQPGRGMWVFKSLSGTIKNCIPWSWPSMINLATTIPCVDEWATGNNMNKTRFSLLNYCKLWMEVNFGKLEVEMQNIAAICGVCMLGGGTLRGEGVQGG